MSDRNACIFAMIVIWSVLAALVIASCATTTITPPRPLLSYDQVKAATAEDYPEVGKGLGELEREVATFRQQLTMAVYHGMIDIDVANTVLAELRVVDYYVTAGWTAMVEGDLETAALALGQGTAAMEKAYGAVKLKGEPV